MKRLNNKGLSYVELMIVIGIMALLVGFSTITLGAVNRNDVGRAGDKLVSYINAGRTRALTNGSKGGYCNLYVHNGNLYANCGERISPTNPADLGTQKWDKVCAKNITLHYGVVPLGEGECINLKFKQSTGEYIGYQSSANDDSVVPVTGELTLNLSNGSNQWNKKINKFGKIE